MHQYLCVKKLCCLVGSCSAANLLQVGPPDRSTEAADGPQTSSGPAAPPQALQVWWWCHTTQVFWPWRLEFHWNWAPSCDWSSGGLGGTTGRRSACMSASTSSSTWSRTAAGSPDPKSCPALVPAAPVHRALSTSSTTSPRWWCIMGRASALATTPHTATTQKEVSKRRGPSCLFRLNPDLFVLQLSSSCLLLVLQASGFTVMTLSWTCVL